ncbi:MAG: dipeptidase [Acutalibacteraceae bacterium]|jgi:membrane dipeptidase
MNYFDLHCDTAYECYTKNQDFYSNSLGVSGQNGNIFEAWKQVFAIWINDTEKYPWQLYKNILNGFKEKLKIKPDCLTPLFAIEGGAVIEDDPDRLYTLAEDGIKYLTLTWNGENRIAGGAKTEKGLTDFGKDVIKTLNTLPIACDLSHLNEKSFKMAIELAERPIASHSNCFEICDNSRNLKLWQIKAIAQKGGIIGICFYPQFLGESDVFEQIYRNINYLCEKGFEDNIAIGSDFDGGKMNERLDNIAKIPSLYTFLAEKGLKNALLNKIFYQNAENYIAKL